MKTTLAISVLRISIQKQLLEINRICVCKLLRFVITSVPNKWQMFTEAYFDHLNIHINLYLIK